MNGEQPESVSTPQPWANRYLLERPLGEGGMAVVWRAWDRRLKAWRAIKILRPRYSRPTKMRQRFELEAQSMANLSNANIVTVHDIGDENGQLFIVMEWLSGGSLHDRLERGGPLPPRQALDVGIAILNALEAAHDAGIVHRDVKPSNVLLDADGRSVLTDFGVARVGSIDAGLTRTGVTMGTLGFMAPEQREDARSADHRADLYATAATLWTLMSGRGPLVFVAPESRKTLDRFIVPEIADIIWKATRYSPEDRYDSAADMRDALQAVLQTLPADPADTPPLAELVTIPPPPTVESLAPEAGGPEQTWAPADSPFTMQPANATMAVLDEFPPPELEDAPSLVVEPEPARRAPAWRISMLLAVLALLAVSAPTLYSNLAARLQDPPARNLTPIPPKDHADTEPVPPEPEPEPEPEVVISDGKPEDAAPEPEPKPEPEPEPDPDPPPEPEPEPEAVVAEVAEDSAVAPEVTELVATVPPARVKLIGDGDDPRLISKDGTTYPVGSVPPGAYTFAITLPSRGNNFKMDLELVSGSTVTIECQDRFGQCARR